MSMKQHQTVPGIDAREYLAMMSQQTKPAVPDSALKTFKHRPAAYGAKVLHEMSKLDWYGIPPWSR